MSDNIKWAVICTDQYDGTVLSVDLFGDYDSAVKYMNEDAQSTFDEMENPTDISNFGQSVTIYIGDDPEYTWVVVPTNTH